MRPPRLHARGLSKTFGSIRVLDSVELVVEPGSVHALVGQNGCGKSTLVKVLTGYHEPDPGGSVLIDDVPVPLPVTLSTMNALSVTVVHQDLGLLDHLSIAENIGVGGYLRTKVLRRIDWSRQVSLARDLLERLELDLDPARPVAGLTATQRAEVAIARALRDQVPGRGLIVLDEATRTLPKESLRRFHGLLQRVVAEGTSVLMVSHSLDEVCTSADRVTVLRDGRVVGSGLPTADLTEQDLARLMLGRSVLEAQERSPRAPSQSGVELTGLRWESSGPIDLTVGRGEIVGVTGLPDSGVNALPYVLGGSAPAHAGQLVTSVGVNDLSEVGVGERLRAGVALVPERRERDGLAYDLSIRDNIALPLLRNRGKWWFLGRGWQADSAQTAIDRFSIKAPGPSTLVKELSGGNQQKTLLAKWLSVAPELLVLHEPTQAVDVGARRDILDLVLEVARSGVAVILVTGEPADLVEVCDRILVVALSGAVTELCTDDVDVVLEAVYAEAAVPGGS